MKEKDLEVINTQYTGFKVLEVFYDLTKNIHRKRQARCLCNCGKEFNCRVDLLNRKKGCKECGQKHGGKSRILNDFGAAKKAYFMSYFRNAANRNLEFSLTQEQFNNIISQNCYYCGMTPQDQSYLSKSTKKYAKFYASGIDRMDNNLGYTLDNCLPCCTKCNMMKKTMSCDEFLYHISAIQEFQKYKVNNLIENNELYSGSW